MTICAVCGNRIESSDPAGFDLSGGFNYHLDCEVEHCTGTADYPAANTNTETLGQP